MNPITLSTLLTLTLFTLTACSQHVPSTASVSGESKTFKTEVLEAGAEMIQSEDPINAIAIYLDGFHFHNGYMDKQIEAHHYCTQMNDDFTQCIIYNGNGKDALLMGVEYVISKRLFETLPMEERMLWHSHVYEVKSGQLIAPGLPQVAQHELMEKLVSTYGKTWHTWRMEQFDNQLPLGFPELMMGFTADGQVHPFLIEKRDRLFGTSTEANREARKDIPKPEILKGADAWEQGNILQLKLSEVSPEKVNKPK